ncbi:MAG: site-specific integrase, partial [Acidobacteriota bacterium]|nr:site-specific integrase [Acidobacteriota bacterium]
WGEVRWAEWPEIDPAARIWTVPESRMKTKREHRVPLCGRAVEILEEARTLEDGAVRLIFTRGGGKPLGSGRLRKLLRWNKVEAAYRRTDLFERRRRLMEDWSSYLAGESRSRASVGLR